MRKISLFIIFVIMVFSNASFSEAETLITNQEAETNETIQEETNKENTELSVLRLDREGISPSFNKNIKEYYFVADATINDLEVTAIPENQNATVTITGNKNLELGKNIITINVVSEDKSKEETYQIYVTKTQNIETANANLENLAVKQGTLNPEFDYNTTKYETEIDSNIKNIDILAIPQSTKASVTIVGNNEMQEGNNIVEINVLAEDGITNKKYEITVHRRNTEEEAQYEQEEKIQAERLSAILEKKENRENQSSNIVWLISVVVLVVATIIGVIIYKRKKKM